MFQTCFECGCRGQVLQSHPLPILPFSKHPKAGSKQFVGPATTQNLVVKFDGEFCGGVLVEHASDDFPQQKKLDNLLPNFAGSSPPISPKTSPTSLWKSLVLTIRDNPQQNATLAVLSHHLECEMKSPHLVDFSWDLVEF